MSDDLIELGYLNKPKVDDTITFNCGEQVVIKLQPDNAEVYGHKINVKDPEEIKKVWEALKDWITFHMGPR